MTAKTNAEIVDRISQILEDTSNAIFADAAQITPQIQDSLSELSAYKPLLVKHTKMAVNSAKLGTTLSGVHTGREIDISDIDRLRYIDRVEYPVGNYPPTYVDFEVYNNMLFLKIPTRPSAGSQADPRGTTQVLTGTVTFTSGSPAVTGSGTAFTSELEVGYYIAKSSGENWYRVATITDDTNLVLAINCAAADTGADSSGATLYWYEYVYLFCAQDHYVEATITDLGGTIDAGAATGYAEGTYKITIDALTAGTYSKDMLFTIAGTEGVYRNTADVVVAVTEGDFIISPRLKGRATENAVVTFLGSTLTPELEEYLCELTAARVAMNWVGDSRTALDNVVSVYGDANATLDKMADITNSANDDCGTALTAASANFINVTNSIAKAETYLNTDAEDALEKLDGYIGDYTTTADPAQALASIDLANTAIDDAELVSDEMNTDIDNQLGGIGASAALITTELAQAITDLDTVEDNLNVVTRGSDPAGKGTQKAMAQMAYANAKMGEMNAAIREGYALNPSFLSHLNTARGYINEAIARINLERTLTGEEALSAREYVRLALGALAEARTFLQADAQKVASLIRVISARLNTAASYYRLASGYFTEAAMSIRLSSAVNSANVWAQRKYAMTIDRLQKSVGVRRSYATV